VTTPTTEPTELRAGDLWEWRREDLTSDYPASSWTLTYRFKNAAGGFEVVAVADGDAFESSVAAATSAAIAAGVYAWQARVTKLTESYTVDTGETKVLPDLFAGTASAASDQRTHARTTLEAIEAVIEGRATTDQQEYTIGTRSLKRIPIAELLSFRDRYRMAVAREDQANGVPNNFGRDRYVRFARG
jgi:hypothetical protein